jgi:hypothetical protein
MGLLMAAACAWAELCGTKYIIELGHKGVQHSINLTFEPDDFPHIAGMQYAKDIDFGLNRSEYFGKNLIPAIVSGRMEEERICKARSWDKIEGRLKAIVNIPQTLSGNFIIAKFNRNKVNKSCSIDAEYVIKNTVSGETFFVFLDSDNDRYYCKSAFQNDHTDYLLNQTVMTVLQVIMETPSEKVELYRHPNFKTL